MPSMLTSHLCVATLLHSPQRCVLMITAIIAWTRLPIHYLSLACSETSVQLIW